MAKKQLGELLPLATTEKNGLLSKTQVLDNLQGVVLSNNQIFKIATFVGLYRSICIRGIEVVSGKVMNIFIYRSGNTTLRAKGDAIDGLEIKTNSDNTSVYVRVVSGKSISSRIEAVGTENIMIGITMVDSFPSDAIDIPFT